MTFMNDNDGETLEIRRWSHISISEVNLRNYDRENSKGGGKLG